MADIERGQFRPVASPRDTVAVQTRMWEGVRPVAPIRPLAPEAPRMPRAPNQGPNALAQLGAALQALNPRVTSALDSYYKGQNEAIGLEADLRAMRDNVTSWSEAVKADPTLADKSPYFRQVYEGRAARTLVQRKSGELLAEYYTSPIAGSDDPGAINKWLSDRLRDTIDSAESPAQRMAMIEETQKLSQQFISAHRQNAVQNLLQNNADSIGAGIGVAIDNYAAQGGSYNSPANVVGKGEMGSLQQVRDMLMQRGLSKTAASAIAGNFHAESKFNTGIEGDGGTSIGLAQWRDPEPGKGRKTDLFNFAKGKGKSATALETQIDFTMYELEKKFPGLVAQMDAAGSVEKAARIFTDVFERPNPKYAYHDRRSAAARQAYAIGGSAVAANPNLEALVGEVQSIEAQGRAQGMNPRQINQLTIEAVTGAMIQQGDESLGDILLEPRPDGTPGAGMTLEGRRQLEAARVNVRNSRVQQENAEFTRQKREREEQGRQLSGQIMDTLLGQIEAGQQPRLPPDVVRLANSIDPDVAEKALNIQKNLDSYDKTENRDAVNQFMARVYGGVATVGEVSDAIAQGVIRDPTTIKNAYEESRRNEKDNFSTDPIIKRALDDIASLVGDPFESGVLANPERSVQAQAALRRSALQFKEQNPRASESERVAFIDKELEQIVRRYKPDSTLGDWKDGNPDKGAGAVTAPGKTPTTSQQDAAPVKPTTGFEWKKRPAYSDAAALEREYQDFIGGNLNNNFGQWVSALGLTSKAQIREFLNEQRRLQEKSKR